MAAADAHAERRDGVAEDARESGYRVDGGGRADVGTDGGGHADVGKDGGGRADVGTDGGTDGSGVEGGASTDGADATPDDSGFGPPPVLSLPPPDAPRPARQDDCSIAGNPGDVVELVPAPYDRFLSNRGGASAVLVDDTHVYFSYEASYDCITVLGARVCSYAFALQRLPRCGGQVETLGLPFNQYARLADGGNSIYYGGIGPTGSGPTWRVNKSDGTREALEIDAACAAGMAANERYVIVLDGCTGRLMRGTHQSLALEPVAAAPPLPLQLDERFRGSVALGTSIAYFPSTWGLVWVDLETGVSGLLSESPAGSVALDLGADHRAVYALWWTPGTATASQRVVRIPLDGSAAQEVAYSPNSGRLDVADGFAYFYSYPEGGIARAPTDASLPAQIVVPAHFHDGVAAYGGRVYWSEQGSLFTVVR